MIKIINEQTGKGLTLSDNGDILMEGKTIEGEGQLKEAFDNLSEKAQQDDNE